MSYQQFGHVDRDERIELAADEPMGEAPRWNLVPRPLINVLVMAGFAGGLYFAYVQGTHHPAATPPVVAPAEQAVAQPTLVAGQRPAATPAVVAQNPPPPDNVPLIKADPNPIKVKPEQPGGLQVPDRNMMIYNERPGGPPVEKLLPPPEQPETRAVAPPPGAMQPQQQVAMAPPAAPAPSAAKPFTPQPIAPRAAPAAHPAATPAALGADKGGHIRVVLASLKTPDEARAEWQRLKKASPDILGKMTADAVRADLGDKGIWYKIEAGAFAEPAAAERVCRELKARHLGCSVVR